MPIPPRPIPSSSTRHARPGASVPRKFSPGNQHTLDWRVEVALLQELGPTGVPRSVPSSSSGVQMVDKKVAPAGARSVGREVDLEGLIRDGRGKREKKATTATSLGFDFVPDHSVLALPDDETEPRKEKPNVSLLSSGKSSSPLPPPSPAGAEMANLRANRLVGSAPVELLSTTPSTPGLVPTSLGAEVEEDDDSDWEHVPTDPLEADEDVIVLGELELDDPAPPPPATAAGGVAKKQPGKMVSGNVSYAKIAAGEA